MIPNTVRWDFTEEPDGSWTWRTFGEDGHAISTSLNVDGMQKAVVDAKRNGFDADSHYWTVTVCGRTTHYRPGRAPLELPAGEEPR